MTVPPGSVLLGTVAIEPNRWGSIDRSGAPTTAVSEYLPDIARFGFDGIEVWERHLTEAPPEESQAVLDGEVPITIFNSYVSFDDPDPTTRDTVASWVRRARSQGVKFNVGNDPSLQTAYTERIATWLEALPPDVTLLCECHAGISIAEDPEIAAAVLSGAGPSDRVQAIIHTDEDPDRLRFRFDAYGDRISHVHVNYLGTEPGRPPTLYEVRSDLERKVALLESIGFRGSWTIEFVHGVFTESDRPEPLLAQAGEDLVVLREILGAPVS
jgi:sugar phosphate isomerase/epimerase